LFAPGSGGTSIFTGGCALTPALRKSVVAGHQKRLELALTFVKDPLPKTHEVASAKGNDVLRPGLIEDAAEEIADAIDRSFAS